MNTYTRREVLRIAKRHNNTKRTYLLVNPLQAKHVPVSPSRSLEMMEALGEKLARTYPDCRLVIGFAETATAIGAAVASCLPEDCVYLHTTREALPGTGWILFQEEHSHAVEQRLCATALADRIEHTEQIILVDDEISTGKTLCNMAGQLRARFPALEGKQLVAASVINRLSPANEERLSQAGIATQCLVKLPEEDYTRLVSPIQTEEAEDLRGTGLPAAYTGLSWPGELPNPRWGTQIGRWRAACLRMAEDMAPRIQSRIAPGSRVLVLGTEECMYPGLILGCVLEQKNQVFCHATTRSPIGIAREGEYPITSGYQLHSFYDGDRETYLYNLARYDAAVVVTDSARVPDVPMGELGRALKDLGCGQLFVVRLKVPL